MVNLVVNHLVTSHVHILNEIRKHVGNKIVYLLLNLPSKEYVKPEIDIDIELINEFLHLYFSKYSRDKQNDQEVINVFNNYIKDLDFLLSEEGTVEKESHLKNLQDFYGIILMIISILNEVSNFVVY
ncbi:MAG: hypothetical protein ACK4GR_05525, partial [bacterium]